MTEYLVVRNLGGRPRKPADQRFWAKVNRGPAGQCWPWTAGTSNGYGCFRVDDNTLTSAHAYAKQLATGRPSPPGLVALHTCKTPDSPLCCNPEHIIYARNGSTTQPMRGENNPGCKLTDDQVRQIRRRAAGGERLVALAREFGVSPVYVSHIKAGLRRTDA